MQTPTSLTFTVTLGRAAHQLAEQFFDNQPWYKAKQVYLNTLAIYAVRFYLKCMGIEASWETSDSYDPVMQLLIDTADLEIPNLGKLECRPVLSGSDVVHIPLDGWPERIGYVAVQLDESMREATLLGFVETVSESEEIPINQLRSLKELRNHLSQLSQPEPIKMRATLSQWLKNTFDPGWQFPEAILGNCQKDFAFRTSTQLDGASVKQAKLINLGLDLESEFVALVVIVTKQAEEEEVTIRVQVHPEGGATYLPPNINLAYVSVQGKILDEAQSRSLDNFIQLNRLYGLTGECFDIKVACGEISVTEKFII